MQDWKMTQEITEPEKRQMRRKNNSSNNINNYNNYYYYIIIINSSNSSSTAQLQLPHQYKHLQGAQRQPASEAQAVSR